MSMDEYHVSVISQQNDVICRDCGGCLISKDEIFHGFFISRLKSRLLHQNDVEEII